MTLKLVQVKWWHHGKKSRYQPSYQNISWIRFIMLTNLSFHFNNENALVGGKASYTWQNYQQLMHLREKLLMFVIGRPRSPRCFKHLNHLPCWYFSQKKSWMDGILFEEWVHGIDREFTNERRKIILLVDNCLAHTNIDNLVSIEILFLPPDTTSKLQSMDQGAIRSLKSHYRA